jgi:hypothetical protein
MGKLLDIIKDVSSSFDEKNEFNEKSVQDSISHVLPLTKKLPSLSNEGIISFNSSSDEKLPRLPWQLERLIFAATNRVLEVNLPNVSNPQSYVMAWACEYLVSRQKEEALKRLWEVYTLWQQGKNQE